MDEQWMRSMEFCSRWFRCHQMPERSFFVKGYQLPLCARCTGMLLGYLAVLSGGLPHKLQWGWLSLCLPLALDGSLQYKTAYMSNNRRRLWTGLLYGVGFGRFLLSALSFGVKRISRACQKADGQNLNSPATISVGR